MLATAKSLSLIEQKRLQWAREREEMVGLHGLWGRPKNLDALENKTAVYSKSSALPPIEGKAECEDQNKAEESETSGYLSDSPKHLNDRDSKQQLHHVKVSNEELNNVAPQQQHYWNEVRNTDQGNYWVEKKMYKNLRNEKWAHENSDSQRFYPNNGNFWYGTPDSLSSDEGSRLRWGDRGVGIGHLWEPVVNHPNCRLPQVADPYRQTPKWVEKGLKNSNGNKADILIIHHPDEAEFDPPQKNYLLGQNAPIPPEVIEERAKSRKKALEHQNAIKKQLEEREMKRRQEKENRIKEEKLEEERIKKEQEIERLRYEGEQRKMKEKEEIEKKKEEVMKEAIELAEKRAKEEKRFSKRHLMNNMNFRNQPESEKKIEKITEQPERIANNRKQSVKVLRSKKVTETAAEEGSNSRKEKNEKTVKDSFSQFEDIHLAQNFQFLNMNSFPVDGGLALMLDNPPKDSNFLLPPDGVQLTLLMSPKTATATNQLMPTTPLVSTSVNIGERILTPSKYRVTERLRLKPINKSTQTDLNYSSAGIKTTWAVGKRRKLNRRYGTNSGSSGASQKFSGERHKHICCFLSSKYGSKNHSSKCLEDRPKWGINRPSVQYKKQSEKDPYYQKKIRERLKKAEVEILCLESRGSREDVREKKINSVTQLLECQTHEDDKGTHTKEDSLLQNGYRMNSNLSSPVFEPIGNASSVREKAKKINEDFERSRSNDLEDFELSGNENSIEDEENTAVPGSVGFLTQKQLEAIRQIASLREDAQAVLSLLSKMIKLDDFLSKKKEPVQVLDLSKVIITSKEDFKKYLDKIPECKVKPEKILPDSVKVKDKEFSFVSGKKEDKQGKEWNYLDPTPSDMKGVKLQDLCPVNIDWKMLTTLRPKTKVDEDMFSRLVQLGKLNLKYQQMLQREKTTDWVRKTKNPKSSIVEMKILSCKACGEDFCDGFMCSKLVYDCFFRPQASTSAPASNLLRATDVGEKKKKKKRRKNKKIRKKNLNKRKRKRLGKNSIFNRPLSQGCSRDHSRWTTKGTEMPRVRAISSTRSFSIERNKTSFFERRSKSAPRIQFNRDVLDSKPKRYVFTSDSGPSQSDYSSLSESESFHLSRKFLTSHLRLSGRRKKLSARTGFSRRNQQGSLSPRRSQFVRRCTLYRGYHRNAAEIHSQGYDTSSESSTPNLSPSKSPKKSFPASAKYPSTIQIHFDEDYETPGLKFPEKIFLPNRIANTKPRSVENNHLRNKALIKIAEGFSKLELGSDEDSTKTFVRSKKEVHERMSGSAVLKLSKFSGPYLKAKGLFEKKLK